MVVPKKNGKIRVCVDYRKLNAVTVTDTFPLPFTDSVLDAVDGHDMYSFLDGFSGYNQVRMHPNDQEKTVFVTDWGVYVRAQDSTNNISTDHHGNFRRIYTGLHASLFG